MPQAENKIHAFDTLRDELPLELFVDNATFFSCNEANAIAVFLTVAHGEEVAQNFLEWHAVGDDDGDLHNPDGSVRKSVIDKEVKA